ncbi:hypothetical protein ACFQH1_12170 [Lactiplantibacillus daoliensis]|uniref:SMODS and SLOG-associating 2TM effector domain-containing protein n=1 Tax=Lactiplantibacillus daoliensis TaxID=2559916 RepID=A0ABW1UJX9_9LACO
MDSLPLITKYIDIEKERRLKQRKENGTVFATFMSITTIFLSVMLAYTVNGFAKTNSWTGIALEILIFWLYAISFVPGIRVVKKYVFTATNSLLDETIILLEDVNIKILKEQVSSQSVNYHSSCHPRKGY